MDASEYRKTLITIWWILGLTVVLVMIIALVVQLRKPIERGDERQREIDSLSVAIEYKEIDFKLYRDSVEKVKEANNERIEFINEIKKVIKNEIQNSTTSVYSTPDSLHQRFVDSIRSREGFHKILYKRE